ncbi:hypothetical protein TWF481_007721 [Arthrobotrys musiformis]|uniref:Uncharacterized protein n=1 Tax=Arthrobotrys musiformis TaxID=47236 RepID=A0AAV9WCC7_9PEZI
MRLTSLLTTLTLVAASLSAITIELAADGVGFSAINRPDLGKRTGSGGCNRDNCLRAMTARISTATSFCHSFTTAVVTQTTGLGPWQTQCANNPSRVSSACTCLIPPPAPTCAPLGGHCTLWNFIQTCCDSPGACVGCKSCYFPESDPNDGFCL